MANRIINTIQDLRALSNLYQDNALSKVELEKCKTRVIDTLRTSREHLTIAELREPLVLLREIYTENGISLAQYQLSRELLMKHIVSDNGGVILYQEIFSFYKQGLLSVKELHEQKKKAVGNGEISVRTGEINNINRLRTTSSPFVPGSLKTNNSVPRVTYKEISEGQWRSDLYPNGPTLSDNQIQTYLNLGWYTIDWGTPASVKTPVDTIRGYVDNTTYNEESVLIQLLGLTDIELSDMITELNSTASSNSEELIKVLRSLLPIITL